MVKESASVENTYLDLLKRVLTRHELEDYQTVEPLELKWVFPRTSSSQKILLAVNRLLRNAGLQLAWLKERFAYDSLEGLGWPTNAETMVGMKRLNSLHDALDMIRQEGVFGDLMETGVWRGGASIFMAAYNEVWGLKRRVFVADSFQGLPPPVAAEDSGATWHTYPYLSVGVNCVKHNFRKYGVLNEHVTFVEGFFRDSLPNLDIGALALLRMDGDMYSSTHDVLISVYSHLSPGGFCFVDDWAISSARNAVYDFFSGNNSLPNIESIDTQGVFWRV